MPHDETKVTAGFARPDTAVAAVGGRYSLGPLLGQGGMGAVYRATDTRTGETLAIKLVKGDDGASRARLRRELAALRWLRMPGVVTLRDDGPVGPDWFIAMDLVDGAPFPAGARTWSALRPLVLRLLEVLARVHEAGVLHLDLKPGNVLIREGEPILLDFGIAQGRAVARAESRAYTPRYAAPEQREGEADVRSDLYAVGKIVREALGRRKAPALVVDLLASMTAPSLEARPDSARTVLRRLGPMEADAAVPDDLRELFVGHDLFHHLREDAAAVLNLRTGGDRPRVRAELASWVASGRARRDGDRVAVDRVGIEQLLDGHTLPGTLATGRAERLLRDAVHAHAPACDVIAMALAAAAELRAHGRPTRAAAVAELGLEFARVDGLEERPLLEAAVLAALCQESIAALDRALYLLERSAPPQADLLDLARGALAAYRAVDRAGTFLDDLTGLSEDLEIWRQGLRARVAATRGLEAERSLLASLEPWARASAERLARRDGWLSNLLYREGRFAESAALRASSARVRTALDARITTRISAADALLEVPNLKAAEELAAESLVDARAARLAPLEALATFVIRSCHYRAGRPLIPQPDHLTAMPGRELEARFALLEAAIAWRASDPRCAALARTGATAFAARGQRSAAELCRALAFAAAPGDPPDINALLVTPWSFAEIGAQVLGLYGIGGVDGLAERTEALATEARPRAQWGARLDVLSLEEAVEGRALRAARA